MNEIGLNIKIRALTPELLEDYLYYFDNAAFTDHAEWSGCYCVEPHLCAAIEEELPKGAESKGRELAISFIKSGKLRGYLAYAGDRPVGWVNVNDKENYEKLAARKELWSEGDVSARIKSVVCFSVAEGFRGAGIASRLLERLIADAGTEGCDIVEAYPYSGEPNVFYYFSGPPSMYEKQGFVIHKKLEYEVIMRKYL